MPRMIEVANRYIANGFSVLPILSGAKVPGYRGHMLRVWQQFCERQARLEELAMWFGASRDADGIAIATGFNGVLAVDVDDDRAAAAVRSVLGGRYAPAKRGKKGATAFFRDPTRSIAARKFWIAGPDGKRSHPMVEVLAHGNQTVIPPSIHPDTGQPYRWLRGDLAEMLPSELPVIMPADIEALAAALAPLMPAKREVEAVNTVKVRADDLPELKRKRLQAMANGLFDKVIADLRDRRDGRYNAANNAAIAFGRWVSAGFLTEGKVREAIIGASTANGLVAKRGVAVVAQQITRGLAFSANTGLPDLSKLDDRPGWRRAA